MDHHRYVVKGGSVSQNAPFGTSVEPTTYVTEHRKMWRLWLAWIMILEASTIITLLM